MILDTTKMKKYIAYHDVEIARDTIMQILETAKLDAEQIQYCEAALKAYENVMSFEKFYDYEIYEKMKAEKEA